MPHLKPVSRVTLVDQVATQIAERISHSHWRVGQRLPSEPELCRTLGIGRSTLREALKSLAFIGMVRMKPGEGTFVADGYSGLSGQIMARGILKTEKDFADLWETRTTLETKLAALAAERADQQDLERLDSLLSQMQANLQADGRSYTDLDMEFHSAVAASAKNRMLREMLVPLRGMTYEWMARSHKLPGKKENALLEHRRIAEAIQRRDPARARKAMEAHLATSQHVYSVLEKMSESEAAASTEVATGL